MKHLVVLREILEKVGLFSFPHHQIFLKENFTNCFKLACLPKQEVNFYSSIRLMSRRLGPKLRCEIRRM